MPSSKKSCSSKDRQRVKQQDVGGTLEPRARSSVCTSRGESDTCCAEDGSKHEK